MDRGFKIERKVNSRDNVSWLSYLTYWYIIKIWKNHVKKDLKEDDLQNVCNKMKSGKLGGQLEKCYKNEQHNGRFSLYKMLIKAYGRKYALYILFYVLFQISSMYLVAMITKKFISFFEANSDATVESRWLYGLGFVFVILLKRVGHNHLYFWTVEFKLQIEIALVSLMYRNILAIDPLTVGKLSTGRIVTLMEKDITAIIDGIFICTDIVMESLQALIIFLMIYKEIGIIAAAPIVIILSSVLISCIIGAMIRKKRLDMNKKTDARLHVMKEILDGIKYIKMYGWEDYFIKKCWETQKSELIHMRTLILLKVAIISLGRFTWKLSFYAVIICSIWFKYNMDASSVYYIGNLNVRLARFLIFLVPRGTIYISEMTAAVKRYENVVFAKNNIKSIPPYIPDFVGVEMRNVYVAVNNENILEDITVRFTRGLNVILGSVASGKTVMLETILGEYPTSRGRLGVNGRLSYASQNCWLFPSSIKQNILFGQAYDRSRYQCVLEVCALTKDLNDLEAGDETIITDEGANLSKGQQTRINLARALYRDADIYLLDDPFASVDSEVKDFIFRNGILGFLKHKICILVTNDREVSQYSCNIIELSGGKLVSCSKSNEQELHSELEQDKPCQIYSSSDISPNIGLEQKLPESGEKDFLLKRNLKAEKANIYYEVNKFGRIGYLTYKKYLTYGGGIFPFLFIIFVYMGVQIVFSYSEKVLSQWINTQEEVKLFQKCTTIIPESTHLVAGSINATDSLVRKCVQILNEKNYETLIRTQSLQTNLYTITTFSCGIILFVVGCTHSLFFIRASKYISKDLTRKVIRSKMTFFDTHLIGNILNRFSRDINNIDEKIPIYFKDCLSYTARLVSISVIISSFSTTFMISSSIVVILYILLAFLFITLSRSVRRLKGSCRSPVVGHLIATFKGLRTIKTFKKEDVLKKEFDKHQDLYNSVNHLGKSVGRALSFIIAIISSCFLMVITLHSIVYAKNTQAGSVGFSINQATFLWEIMEILVEEWCSLESLMSSVERVLEYTQFEQEDLNSGIKLEKWPTHGIMELKDMSLTYPTSRKSALPKITFTVKAHEKLGLIGRTGEGKTSIVMALFRFYHMEGDIVIDEVNIRNIPLKTLRHNLSVIPQIPFVFEGTFRQNIDPMDEYSDEAIWDAVEVVGMKRVVKSLNDDCIVKKLSMGQRQLLCLARVILKNNKILIFDEATASIDYETEELILKKIKEIFTNQTMLIITHKKKVALMCDRLMLLKEGKLQFLTDYNEFVRKKM